MKDLKTISIQYLKGVGPARKKLFANLGISTIEDLLYFFPHRYEDRSRITPIALARPGEFQAVVGDISHIRKQKGWYTRKPVCEVDVVDKSGRLTGVWFNQLYIAHYFKPGQRVVMYGKVDVYKKRLQIVNPEYEILEEEETRESLNLGRIVPVYPLTRGLTQRGLRKLTRLCLDRYAPELKDVLPYSLRHKYQMENIVRSLGQLHYPEDFEAQKKAFYRICFEEFFFFQVAMSLRKRHLLRQAGIAHQVPENLLKSYEADLPFVLTAAQKKVLGEIVADMRRPYPMHRLVQGDVGSGKTVVAFFGCLLSAANGCQSVVMAPTEILARQHFEAFKNFFGKKTFASLRVELLVSQQKNKQELLRQVREGEVNVLVGTHAVLQEDICFKRLSFAVIDEQHKFGVRQRALLSAKGEPPDVLVMTATPIPRTLCLTLFGDLDVSIIDQLPPGRGKIKTLQFSDRQSAQVYALIRAAVERKEQVFVVYPLISESLKVDLKAAEERYRYFRDQEFKGYRIGLMHGEMKRADAEQVMADFKKGALEILVTTSILEVGIDVPNATVMVIEHADRFGLSQLHQMRGRIGRGAKDAVCVLVAEATTPPSQARLKAMLTTTDGFKIAQYDLMIRGPGEFFGRHQHGLNELKIANPAAQLDILELSRAEAVHLLSEDPQLERPECREIKTVVEHRYPNYLGTPIAG